MSNEKQIILQKYYSKYSDEILISKMSQINGFFLNQHVMENIRDESDLSFEYNIIEEILIDRGKI